MKAKMFENRTFGFYAGVISAVCVVCAAIIYYNYSRGNNSYVSSVCTWLLVGVVCEVINMFVDFPVLPILPAVCYGFAFATLMTDRFTMFSDYINGVVGLSSQGNILWLIITILAMILVSIIGGCICSFSDQRKKTA